MSYKIQIVEDDPSDRDRLKLFLEQYGKDNNESFIIESFSNGFDFIESYKSEVDIVFIDIKMPLIDGMTVAKKLRLKDKCVKIVFVTSMTRFAIDGYSIGVNDYLVKPIKYADFSIRLKKLLGGLCSREKKLPLTVKDGFVQLEVNKIIYIESLGHNIIYHTTDATYERNGVLYEVEKEMEKYNTFVRCNRSYITTCGI